MINAHVNRLAFNAEAAETLRAQGFFWFQPSMGIALTLIIFSALSAPLRPPRLQQELYGGDHAGNNLCQ